MTDTPADIPPGHIEWSRAIFHALKDKGMWGLPRAGLLFQRRGDRLVLTDRMPWVENMEGIISPEEWTTYQEQEATLIQRTFKAAGIEVEIAPS